MNRSHRRPVPLATQIRTLVRAVAVWASANPIQWWALVVVLGLFFQPMLGWFVSNTDGWKTVVLIAFQTIIGIALWAVPFLQKRAAEADEVEVRSELLVAFGDTLNPLMTLLGRLADAPSEEKQETIRGQLVTAVLHTASSFIGPKRSRASYFRFENDMKATLIAEHSTGRDPASRAIFRAGTPDGDEILKMIRQSGTKFVRDVTTDPPAGWDPAKRGNYKTFISVPVVAGRSSFGMLSLDSLEPGDLTATDARMLFVFGRLLGTGLAIDRFPSPDAPTVE